MPKNLKNHEKSEKMATAFSAALSCTCRCCCCMEFGNRTDLKGETR